jgi:hypothetical protein
MLASYLTVDIPLPSVWLVLIWSLHLGHPGLVANVSPRAWIRKCGYVYVYVCVCACVRIVFQQHLGCYAH